jgi:hypothetical protein
VRYTLSLFQVEKAVTLGVRVLAPCMVLVVVAQVHPTARVGEADIFHNMVTAHVGELVVVGGAVAVVLITMT